MLSLASLFLFSGLVAVEIRAPDCYPSWSWSYNSLHQNPCMVAAYLASTCSRGSIIVETLPPRHQYSGPDGIDDPDLCMCNTVMYSLFSACAACQGEVWMPWPEYTHNCTKVLPSSSFPNPIPYGTRIPYWALIDVTVKDTYNVRKARTIGGTPEAGSGTLLGHVIRFIGATNLIHDTALKPTSHIHGVALKPMERGAVMGRVAALSIICAAVFYLRWRRQFSFLTCQSPTPSAAKASTSSLDPFGSDSRPADSSQSPTPSSSKPSTFALDPFGSDPRFASSSSSRVNRRLGKLRAPPSGRDNSILKAMRLHFAQRAQISKSTRRLFECGICMEKMSDNSIARPHPCGHAFCRECLRRHVTARLDEHRFPILCPTCTASKGKGKGATGEVSQSLALDLGLTDEQYNIWTEMELTSFSVLLHCRKCQRTMFVARDDHEEAKIIACPLPDCNHVWCKQCQQPTKFGGPKHSCDGTSELDRLMKEQGWKYCPTCKTPIQKISGCNHISCISPACNTQFCYICGGVIVRSALDREIKEAMSEHYSKGCMLFEVPN